LPVLPGGASSPAQTVRPLPLLPCKEQVPSSYHLRINFWMVGSVVGSTNLGLQSRECPGRFPGLDLRTNLTTRVTKKCRYHPSLPPFSFLSFSFFRSRVYGPVRMHLGSNESRETLFLHRHRRSPACPDRDPAQVLISCLGVYRSKILPRPLVPCACQ